MSPARRPAPGPAPLAVRPSASTSTIVRSPPAGAHALAGRLTLDASAAVLERAAVVVGGDTGPLHVARALGRPVVAVFFAADPARTRPAGFASEAPFELVRGAAGCAPCLARRC